MNYCPKIPGNLNLVAPANEGPQFQHDCDCCHFVGRYKDSRYVADLYVHIHVEDVTVVARLSDTNSDYLSSYVSSFGNSAPLTEARDRAEKLGLIKYDVYSALNYAAPGSADASRLSQEVVKTREYQAYQAHLQEDSLRCDALLNELVNEELTKQQAFQPETTRGGALIDVESRLAKVIVASGKHRAFDALMLVSEMTKAEWDKVAEDDLDNNLSVNTAA